MSDTPETDYALQGVQYRGDGPGAFTNHARRLERERDRAEAMLRTINDHLQAKDFDATGALWAAHDLADLVRTIDAEKKIREGVKR